MIAYYGQPVHAPAAPSPQPADSAHPGKMRSAHSRRALPSSSLPSSSAAAAAACSESAHTPLSWRTATMLGSSDTTREDRSCVYSGGGDTEYINIYVCVRLNKHPIYITRRCTRHDLLYTPLHVHVLGSSITAPLPSPIILLHSLITWTHPTIYPLIITTSTTPGSTLHILL